MNDDVSPNIILDVIVPVRNGGKYIRDSIGCVLVQTIVRQIRILIVDDGSTDDTAEICDEFAAANENVFVFHIAGGGVSAARNFGIDKAEAEFIAFLDADDFIYPDCYEKLVGNATAYDCDISACGYVETSERSAPPRKDGGDTEVWFSSDRRGALEKMICGGLEGYIWNKVFRRTLINSIRFTAYRNGEDCIFSWDAVRAARRICLTDEKLYVYYTSHKLYPPMKDGVEVYRELLKRAKEDDIEDIGVLNTLRAGYVQHIISMARDIALGESSASNDPDVPGKSDARAYLADPDARKAKLPLKQKLRVFLLKHAWGLFRFTEKIVYDRRRRRRLKRER